MWSVEMRESRPRNAIVLSSGIAASIGATSVATADRPLAFSRSRTVFRYWMVDSLISGVTPGSPPSAGQVPNAAGVVGTGVLPVLPVPPLPARLLRGMDDADHEIEYVEEGCDALEPVRAAKTYHVDVVFRFTVAGGTPVTSLRRLIIDRNGIKRIEGVEAAAAS